MTEMKNLAKQTAVYGLSSILGKFLNWCLVPLYTYVLASSAEYGIVTNLYAWTALLIVFLTYGMETGFFRFVNKKEENATAVYSSSLICSIVAMDAFGAIPFAYLRYKNRALRFAILKLIMIFVNIFFNIFFLVVCPKLQEAAPALVDWFYDPGYGVGYVLIANMLSTAAVTLLLIPEIKKAKIFVDFKLLKQILRYSLPLLVLGIAGIMNQTVDKIIFPFLMPDREIADSQLGIYGACFKIAMVMMVFTQAFRYAYEPFIFAQNKGGDKRGEYADAMKFFVIFSMLIFLGMMFYLDILKYLIRNDYWEGLRIVPVILMSYFFQGVFFNLSLWYKLIDKTQYGAYLSLIGLVITLAINILFVPYFGYLASAAASLVCYFAIMLISYYLGQKHYPIVYDLKSIGLYFVVAIGLFAVSCISPAEGLFKYLQNTVLLVAYLALIIRRDLPLRAIPVVNKFFKK